MIHSGRLTQYAVRQGLYAGSVLGACRLAQAPLPARNDLVTVTLPETPRPSGSLAVVSRRGTSYSVQRLEHGARSRSTPQMHRACVDEDLARSGAPDVWPVARTLCPIWLAAALPTPGARCACGYALCSDGRRARGAAGRGHAGVAGEAERGDGDPARMCMTRGAPTAQHACSTLVTDRASRAETMNATGCQPGHTSCKCATWQEGVAGLCASAAAHVAHPTCLAHS